MRKKAGRRNGMEKPGKNGMKRIKKIKGRLAAGFLAAALLATPGIVYAGEAGEQVLTLHHTHTGSEETGKGCYTEIRYHVHEGNPGAGGSCYDAPIYHVHTGNETEGGGCYGKKVYHEHLGSAAEGGACYGTAVRHVHKGDAAKGGGCYLTPVYHFHAGNKEQGGECYQTPVYHIHTGSAAAGGGCYGEPVYHAHTGSASAGGGCYGTPVFHRHTGSLSEQGGCYLQPVRHVHSGSEAAGGGCYAPVCHQHTDACYEIRECQMKYVGGLVVKRTETGGCYHHGTTQVAYIEADYEHQSCGAGQERSDHKLCWECQNLDRSHEYRALVCGRDTGTPEGYRLACGKNADTVESWGIGCGRDENTVEGYTLNCKKTEKTAESYRINCGRNGQTTESYALSCRKDEKSIDSYKTVCGSTEETVERYELSCRKTEETVDSYVRSCEKDERCVDAYALSCERTEETVDGYERGCGLEEDGDCGEITLRSMNTDWTKGPVILSASLTGQAGSIPLSEKAFFWEGNGIEARAGSRASVRENGTCRLKFRIEGGNIKEKEGSLSLAVKNIDQTAPVIKTITYGTQKEAETNRILVEAEDLQPDGSQGSGLAEEACSFDGGRTWSSGMGMEAEKNGEISIAVRDACGNIAVDKVMIENIREEDPDPGEDDDSGDNSGDNGGKDDDSGDNGGDKDGGSDQEKEKTAPVPEKKPETGKKEKKPETGEKDKKPEAGEKDKDQNKNQDKKQNLPGTAGLAYAREEQTIRQPQVNAEPAAVKQPETIRKRRILEPVVKAVTFTAGSVALAAGLMYLVFLMFRSIRVYRHDGEEKFHYAGTCIVEKTEGGFTVRIPDMIREHSATGQYMLRPGSLFVKKHKGEELIVMAGGGREAVWVGKEIPLRLDSYA